MDADELMDWDAGSYDSFRRLRSRPAGDLLSAVPQDIPPGPIVDLGCGSGAAAPLLAGRFPDRMLIGVDRSPVMLEEAMRCGLYDHLVEQDIRVWQPGAAPALLFSNAVLHWLSDHAGLMLRLVSMITDSGVLAVQMPRQLGRPSHDLLYLTAHELFPDRFDGDVPQQVRPPDFLHGILRTHGSLSVWETEYLQHLPASIEGHPVRMFTQSTAARPILKLLTPTERDTFLKRYDARLLSDYPLLPDGSTLMPFRRQFAVLMKGT